MTFFLWCEWIGKNCNKFHRAKFDVEVRTAPHFGYYYEKDGICIHDSAYTIEQRKKHSDQRKSVLGSKIYVSYDDTAVKIKNVLTDYLLKYYEIKPDSLTIEVCA